MRENVPRERHIPTDGCSSNLYGDSRAMGRLQHAVFIASSGHVVPTQGAAQSIGCIAAASTPIAQSMLSAAAQKTEGRGDGRAVRERCERGDWRNTGQRFDSTPASEKRPITFNSNGESTFALRSILRK